MIYATFIFKQQNKTVITLIIQWKLDIQRIDFIIKPVKGTNKCY